MEPKGSSPCSQEPAAGSSLEPDKFSPQLPHPISLRSILISSSHLHLCHPIGLLHSDFPTKTLYALSFTPMHVTCPAILILLGLITYLNVMA
jgi:hypothetical protein